MAAMNPPRPRSLSVCCAAGETLPTVRPAYANPAADQPREQGATRAAQRQRERPDFHAEQSDQQPCANAGRKECNIGPVTIAQHLADFGCGTFDVVSCADQRHHVAKIDPRFRSDRYFLASARQIPQEHAASGIPDPLGDFSSGSDRAVTDC